jgi:thiol-disulfide isomerase/thioredoxin
MNMNMKSMPATRTMTLVQRGTSHTVIYPAIVPKEFQRHTTKLDSNNFNSFLKEHEGKMIVLDVHSHRCEPCRQSLPKFHAWADEYREVEFGEMEFAGGNRKLLNEMGIKAVPTFLVYDNGKLIFQTAGTKQLDEIERLVKTVGDV